MPRARTDSVVHLSHHHTPGAVEREVFYSVSRAGHVTAAPDRRYAKDSWPGHEIIVCLSGRGYMRQRGRVHAIEPGQAVWVNCFQPHAYWPEPSDPWEYYWLRFDGPKLDAIWKMLLAAGGPVVTGCDSRQKLECVRRIFDLLERQPRALTTLIHAEVARLISLLFDPFHSHGKPAHEAPEIPEPLRRALEHMRLESHRPLRVAELAGLAGMSPSHFIRSFKRATGTSPIDWVRRERVRQAQRRLAETDDSMKEIARQIGYSDQFYFSRDFKRLVGLAPSEYRRREKENAGEGRVREK